VAGLAEARRNRSCFADVGSRKVPDNLTDEQVLFLTDIFPTGWTAIDWAELKGGETVAVFGCGPVGLMAMKSAWLRGAGRVIGLDSVPYRLERARASARVETINIEEHDPIEALCEMTQGRGPDVCRRRRSRSRPHMAREGARGHQCRARHQEGHRPLL
jgi:alcohol dehydrogenase